MPTEPPQSPVAVKKDQLALWANDPSTENPDYLTRQLLTYDAFSGSWVVSRFMKAHSSSVISNLLRIFVEKAHV